MLIVGGGLCSVQAKPPSVIVAQSQLAQARTDLSRVSAYATLVKFYQKSDIDSAYHYGQLGFALAERIDDRRHLALFRLTVIDYYTFHNDDRGLYYLANALASPTDKHEAAFIQYSLANLYFFRGKYVNAAPVCLMALHQFQELRDPDGMQKTMYLLGLIYFNSKDYLTASRYFDDALVLARKNKSIYKTNVILVYRAELHAKLNQHEKALIGYEEGLQMARENNLSTLIASCLNGIGRYWLQQDKPTQALHFFEDAQLEAKRKLGGGDPNVPLIRSYAGIGSVYLHRQKPHLALPFIQQAILLSRQDEYSVFREQLLPLLIDAQTRTGDDKGAVASFRELGVLQDSLFSVEKSRTIDRLQMKFDLEKNENDMKLLSRDLIVQQQRNWLFYSIIGFLILLLLVSGWFFRRTQITSRQLIHQNQLIEHQGEELYELNQTKDKLFDIVAHELRSPIAHLVSTLTLFNNKAMSEHDLRQKTDSLQQQVEQFYPMLNNLLHWTDTQKGGLTVFAQPVEPETIISDVIHSLEQMLLAKRIRLINRTKGVATGWADENHMQIVFRNIIHNAIKFTNPGGSIYLNAIHDEEFTGVSVHNTGQGMSAEKIAQLFLKPESAMGTAGEVGTGLGLQVCRELIDTNGGQLHITSQPEEGTVVTILIPVSSAVV